VYIKNKKYRTIHALGTCFYCHKQIIVPLDYRGAEYRGRPGKCKKTVTQKDTNQPRKCAECGRTKDASKYCNERNPYTCNSCSVKIRREKVLPIYQKYLSRQKYPFTLNDIKHTIEATEGISTNKVRKDIQIFQKALGVERLYPNSEYFIRTDLRDELEVADERGMHGYQLANETKVLVRQKRGHFRQYYKTGCCLCNRLMFSIQTHDLVSCGKGAMQCLRK